MICTRAPRAAAPVSIPAHVSLIQRWSGTMITAPGCARLYSIARAIDEFLEPKPTSLCTCSAVPTNWPSFALCSCPRLLATVRGGAGMWLSEKPLPRSACRRGAGASGAWARAWLSLARAVLSLGAPGRLGWALEDREPASSVGDLVELLIVQDHVHREDAGAVGAPNGCPEASDVRVRHHGVADV